MERGIAEINYDCALNPLTHHTPLTASCKYVQTMRLRITSHAMTRTHACNSRTMYSILEGRTDVTRLRAQGDKGPLLGALFRDPHGLKGTWTSHRTVRDLLSFYHKVCVIVLVCVSV